MTATNMCSNFGGKMVKSPRKIIVQPSKTHKILLRYVTVDTVKVGKNHLQYRIYHVSLQLSDVLRLLLCSLWAWLKVVCFLLPLNVETL